LESKEILRNLLRQKLKVRRQKDVKRIGQEQDLLTKHLIDFLKQKTGVWAAFNPIHDEPSLSESIESCRHIQWVYPLVEGNTLSFWKPQSLGDWRSGYLGILEPDPKKSQFISIPQIDGFLIPGLGFDTNGARLGRGKGFYDRALEMSPGEKVGVAFSVQVLADELACDPWDILMDALVTDVEVKKFPRPGKK